jgi:hypothetical protein
LQFRIKKKRKEFYPKGERGTTEAKRQNEKKHCLNQDLQDYKMSRIKIATTHNKKFGMKRNKTIFNRDNRMTNKTLSRRDNMLVENEIFTIGYRPVRDGMWMK